MAPHNSFLWAFYFFVCFVFGHFLTGKCSQNVYFYQGTCKSKNLPSFMLVGLPASALDSSSCPSPQLPGTGFLKVRLASRCFLSELFTGCLRQVRGALSSALYTQVTRMCHFPKVTQLLGVRGRIRTQDHVGQDFPAGSLRTSRPPSRLFLFHLLPSLA